MCVLKPYLSPRTALPLAGWGRWLHLQWESVTWTEVDMCVLKPHLSPRTAPLLAGWGRQSAPLWDTSGAGSLMPFWRSTCRWGDSVCKLHGVQPYIICVHYITCIMYWMSGCKSKSSQSSNLLVEIKTGISPGWNQNHDLCRQDFKSCQYIIKQPQYTCWVYNIIYLTHIVTQQFETVSIAWKSG